MQTEKFTFKKRKTTLADQLRALKKDDCIRITTAVGARSALGTIARLKRTLKKNFSTAADGDDVIIYIRGNGV